MKTITPRRSPLAAGIALLTLLAGLPAEAAEDWYLYVALDGGDTVGVSPPSQVNAYAPDGSLVWELELLNTNTFWRWFGLAYSEEKKLLYALAFGTKRIYRYDRLQGAFIDTFTGTAFEFNTVSIAIGPNGNIYTGNESHDGGTRGGIQEYDSLTGAHIGEFSDGDGGTSITWGPDGNLYRTTASGQIAQHMGSDGSNQFVYATVPGGRVTYPLWHDGALYVSQARNGADSNRVVKITDSGFTVSDFVPSGSGGLDRPAGFAFTPDGDLLVAMGGINTPGNMIKRYNGTTGAYIDDFAVLPTTMRPVEVALEIVPPAGTNDYTYFVAIDGAEDFNVSTNQDKIYEFDDTDTIIRTLDDHPDDDTTNEWARWSGLALGPDGLLYVSSLEFDAVYRWNPDDGIPVDQWIGSALLCQVDDIAFGGPNPKDLYAACQGPATKQIQASPDNVATNILDATTVPQTHTTVGWGPANIGSSNRFMYAGHAAGQIHIYQDGDTNKVQDMARGNAGRPTFTGLVGFPGHVEWHDDYMYVSSTSNILYYSHLGYTSDVPDVRGRFLGEFASAPTGTIFQGFGFAPNGDLLVTGHQFFPGVGRTNWVFRYDGRSGALLNQSDPLPTESNALTSGLAVYELFPMLMPASFLSIGVSNSMIGVTFGSFNGQSYDVQLDSDVVSGTWTNDPANEGISGTGSNIVISVDPTEDTQGIRVSTEFE